MFFVAFPVTRTVFPLLFNPSYQFSSFFISSVFQPSFSVASNFFAFSSFSDYHVGLFWVISVVLSRLELFLVSLSLVWYVLLLLLLFTFTCSGVRGSLWSLFVPSFPLFWPNFCLFIIRLPFLSLAQSCVPPLGLVVLSVCTYGVVLLKDRT